MSEAELVSLPQSQAEAEPQAFDVIRRLEAVLFAAKEPISQKLLSEALPPDTDIEAALAHLQKAYAERGVRLVRIGKSWAFRTADDLSFLLQKEIVSPRKLSKAALEILAIIAYHQPVTRAEIENVRAVATSKGSLDVLLETGWVRMRGRRKSPGRPVTYGTSEAFLDHFSLESLDDLPGLEELKGAGLLAADLPPDFALAARPSGDVGELQEDEEAFTLEDVEELGLLSPSG